MSCCHGAVPGPSIHLLGLCSCGMPGPWGAVGGEDHAVIKSSLERKGGCKLVLLHLGALILALVTSLVREGCE